MEVRFDAESWEEDVLTLYGTPEFGWLKFKGTSPVYGVRSMAFDTQSQGTPNWWLDHHMVTEVYDAGGGVSAWRKYVMDTECSTDREERR